MKALLVYVKKIDCREKFYEKSRYLAIFVFSRAIICREKFVKIAAKNAGVGQIRSEQKNLALNILIWLYARRVSAKTFSFFFSGVTPARRVA